MKREFSGIQPVVFASVSPLQIENCGIAGIAGATQDYGNDPVTKIVP